MVIEGTCHSHEEGEIDNLFNLRFDVTAKTVAVSVVELGDYGSRAVPIFPLANPHN